MSAKKAAPGVTKATTVVANDPDDLKGALKFIGGSRSDSWNNIPANQAVETLWLKNSDKAARDQQYGATVAALAGIRPRDELEGMLAGQLLAAHNAAMECYRRAMIGEQTFEGRRENLSQANKLSRTYAALLDALNRHRGKSTHKSPGSATGCAGGSGASSGSVRPWVLSANNRALAHVVAARVLGYNGNGAHFRWTTDEVAKGGYQEFAFR
jgi:hypothetical protein